jgi:hypothetical protein
MPEVKDNEKPHISQVNILKTNSYEFYITEPVPNAEISAHSTRYHIL